MENPRAEKVAVVDEVKERLNASNAALLTEYRGLKVSEMATLRRALREAGGEYKVYKNTLVRFAARDLGIEDLEAMLEGPTAIAFVDGDAASVAKALRDFARANPNLVVKGGLLGDKVLTAAAAGALADLPSRDVLLARLAGAMAAPMQQLAGLLAALPRNFAYGLKALIDQGGAPGAPAAAPAASEEPAAAASDEPAAAESEEPAAPAASDEPAAPAASEEPAPATAVGEATAEGATAESTEGSGGSDEVEPSAEPTAE